MLREDENIGDDGLQQPHEVIEVLPLAVVAAGALLTAVASLAWAVSRAWRSLGKFYIVLEDGYERSYTDGYWRH